MVVAAVAASVVASAGTQRPAAACAKRRQTVFELFDLATTVGVMRVDKAPGRRAAGPVELTIRTPLKGRRGRVVARETNTSCRTGFRAGRTALVFLDRDGWATGHFDGYRERPSAAMLSSLQAWRQAATDRDRGAVLVAAITGGDRALATEAAGYLVDEPAILAALDPAAVAALSQLPGHLPGAQIELVLARLRGPAWKDLVAGGGLPARGPVAALAAHDLDALTTTAALADVIATEPGERAPRRIAAMERCERLHGRRLARFSRYGHGASSSYWTTLAAACRTGAPAP